MAGNSQLNEHKSTRNESTKWVMKLMNELEWPAWMIVVAGPNSGWIDGWKEKKRANAWANGVRQLINWIAELPDWFILISELKLMKWLKTFSQFSNFSEFRMESIGNQHSGKFRQNNNFANFAEIELFWFIITVLYRSPVNLRHLMKSTTKLLFKSLLIDWMNDWRMK